MKKEVFTHIRKYKGIYEISNYGRIYSIKSEKFFKLLYLDKK